LKISSGDLLMTNATIIIGLLVLLTFSSVASPFGQEERSAFFANWYALQIEINSGDRVLSKCNDLRISDTERTESLVSALTTGDPEKIVKRGENGKILSSELDIAEMYDEVIKYDCAQLAFDKLKLTEKLKEMDTWGITYKYLENKSSNIVESQYHKDLASGPYSVNMINLAMIMPFLFSAILDTIISSRKEKTEVASNIGIGLMVAGFVIVVVGLTLIGISFYQAASPFL